jgi:Cu(I)/Ag(I) efflux system protein CusF
MPALPIRRLAFFTLLSLALLPLASWSQSDDKVAGEVRKVDRDNQKITIKHGEIKSFDMPPMTMVFTVKDPVLLDAAKPGDKVRFGVAREDGKFVVTAIEVAP